MDTGRLDVVKSMNTRRCRVSLIWINRNLWCKCSTVSYEAYGPHMSCNLVIDLHGVLIHSQALNCNFNSLYRKLKFSRGAKIKIINLLTPLMRSDSAVLLWELFYHVVKTHVLVVVHMMQMAVSPIWMFKSACCYVKSEVVDSIKYIFISKRRQRFEGSEEEIHPKRAPSLSEKEVYYGKYLPQDIHKKFLRSELVLVITDIVKSTTLWNLSPDAMYRTIETHDAIARRLCKMHGGYEIRNEGDSFFLIFVDTQSAIDFSVEFYQEIKRVSVSSGRACTFRRFTECKELWNLPLELRIAINRGPVVLRRDEFFCVHGDVVTNTYGMLEHSHSNSICIFEDLKPSIAGFGKEVPFCIHK